MNLYSEQLIMFTLHPLRIQKMIDNDVNFEDL